MRSSTITRVLGVAVVFLVLWGFNPGVAAAASPSESPHRHDLAVFEWQRLSQVNAKVSDQRLGSLRADGFKTVYADLGEYLEVFDQPESRTQRTRLGQLNGELRRFVARASRFGLAVHAVGGGPNWTDATRRYLGPKLLGLVAEYNQAAGANERLQGVQFDIEPYVDPSFWNDVETFHLIDMLAALPEAYVLVMAYRNLTAGDDGSIAHVLDELNHARQAGAACGIVVGQEFNKVAPEKLTFWWAGRAAFWRAAEELAGALAEENVGYAQFRGISVNDLTAYQAARA